MNILQIWIGKEPDAKCKDLMNANRGKGRYILIADTDFIGADEFINADEYWEDNIKNEIPEITSHRHGLIITADLIRIKYLSENECVYMDCDAYIDKIPTSEKPLIVKKPTGMLHYYFLSSYNGTDLFKTIYEKWINYMNIEKNSLEINPQYLFEVLNNKRYRDRFDFVSRETVTHLNLKSWQPTT